ncbi:MAG: divergent polysaccharide deacetylase family protein [Candidatus Cloacimonetes bacterium]|nr:divergent polysaccharide deacetylase family protein [Candidatus Cloacimonadota bacterium]
MARKIDFSRTRKREVNKKNKGRLFLVMVFSFVILSLFIYIASRNIDFGKIAVEDDIDVLIPIVDNIEDSNIIDANLPRRQRRNRRNSREINNIDSYSEENSPSDTTNSDRDSNRTHQVESEATGMSSREQISFFAEIFGVLPRLMRSTNRAGQVEIQLPVNFAAVDLNYTNFRLTTYLTSLGWTQISGIESANQNMQVLTFVAPDEIIYSFRISYDRTGAYPAIRPRMAIIIKGFGNLNQNDLERWIQLDKNICFSILPINRTSRMNIQQLVNNNFEALIEIPMEDIGHPIIQSPDYAIFGHFRDNEVIRKLDQYFSLLPGARGTITHRGGLITTDRRIMPIILNYIRDREMYFIDDKAIETSIAFSLAQQMMLTSFERSIIFNPKDYINDTNNQRLTNDLRRVGMDPMIVTLQNPDDDTYIFIQKLINVANESGYQIVRVSDLN